MRNFFETVESKEVWDLQDYDCFLFYKDFSNEELKQIIKGIDAKIESLPKTDRKVIEDIDKEIIDYYKNNIEERWYKEFTREEGPSRFSCNFSAMRTEARRPPKTLLRMAFNKNKMDFKGMMVDDKKEKHKVYFKRDLNEDEKEIVKELNKDKELWDEYYKRYAKIAPEIAEIDRKKEEVGKLSKKYEEAVKQYRLIRIREESNRARWMRLKWVVSTELALRKYETDNGLAFSRTPVSSKSEKWKNFKIRKVDGKIKNVIFLKNKCIPYLVTDLVYTSNFLKTVEYYVMVLNELIEDPERYEMIYFTKDRRNPFRFYDLPNYLKEEPEEYFLLLPEEKTKGELVEHNGKIWGIEYEEDEGYTISDKLLELRESEDEFEKDEDDSEDEEEYNEDDLSDENPWEGFE